jgi:hypothetical protein
MTCVGKCGAYGGRPDFCKKYPTINDFIPPGCTYTFHNGERSGECDPTECGENNCCSYPREKGEPEGRTLDSLEGGLPCKHLKWDEVDTMEKDASVTITRFEEEYNNLIAEVLHNVK